MRIIDADAYREELCSMCGASCTNRDNEFGPCCEVRLLDEQPTIEIQLRSVENGSD